MLGRSLGDNVFLLSLRDIAIELDKLVLLELFRESELELTFFMC